MKVIAVFLILILLIFLAYYHIETTITNLTTLTYKNADQIIVKHRTTQQEVLKVFGKPNVIIPPEKYMHERIEGLSSILDANEVWIYLESKTFFVNSQELVKKTINKLQGNLESSVLPKKFTKLIIYFDKQGKILDFALRIDTVGDLNLDNIETYASFKYHRKKTFIINNFFVLLEQIKNQVKSER